MDTITIDFSRTPTEEDLQKNPLARHCAGIATTVKIKEGWQEELRKSIRKMLAKYETIKNRWWWNQWNCWITNDTGDTLAHIREPLPATEHDIIDWVEKTFQSLSEKPKMQPPAVYKKSTVREALFYAVERTGDNPNQVVIVYNYPEELDQPINTIGGYGYADFVAYSPTRIYVVDWEPGWDRSCPAFDVDNLFTWFPRNPEKLTVPLVVPNET